jgi:M6 family metalloprotease-like protein
VNGWVKVPFNEARYGRDFCNSIVCNNTWFLIRDAMAFWVQGQLASGKTIPQTADYLKTFDKWDRYDLDGDGNFKEPDGFIDHFQIVHAGGDQAAGDPNHGTDAIWSHRWYASVQAGGPGGLPGVNAGSGGVSSGVTIPSNPTGVWVGDYTIQPENGGLGVFAHEYSHDLGLPDLCDTSGNTGGAENSTAFWTLMSSGANIGDGGPNGSGDAPTDWGAWHERRRPQYDDVEAGLRRGPPHGRCLLRHPAALRLRVHRGFDQRWYDVHAGRDQPVDARGRRSERYQRERCRNRRNHRWCIRAAHGDAAGRHERHPWPLHDGRRSRSTGLPTGTEISFHFNAYVMAGRCSLASQNGNPP